MKKILLFFLFIGLILSSPRNIFAQESWVIDNFSGNIEIQNDGVVRIEETISADFGSLSKHGIFRDIPLVYENGAEKIYTKIQVDTVLRNGETENYRNEGNNSTLRLRIGKGDVTISGKQVYTIIYRVTGVLRGFEDHDELFWNVTGNDWEVPIQKASARVSTTVPIIDFACFEGSFGSNQTCTEKSQSGNEVQFSSEDLSQGEGLTIVIGYPKGLIPILTIDSPKTVGDVIRDPISLLLGLGTIIGIIFFVFRRWWNIGRDKVFIAKNIFEHVGVKTKPIGYDETVVVEYEPPDKLRPAEIGVVMDERADTRDVSATIIDLAVRGYIEITEIPKKWLFGSTDYELKKVNPDTSKLLSYERVLFDKLFSHVSDDTVKISQLKQKFYSDLKKVKDELYKEATVKKFFTSNPETVRQKNLGIGFVMVVFGIILAIFSGVKLFPFIDSGIALSVGGLLTLLLTPAMPRRTPQGSEINRRIKGYFLFLDNVEKHKQKFFENKNMFNEVLPYTIMFGMTEKFAEALKDMGVKPPEPTWYHGVGTFNAVHFGNNISTFSSSLSSSIASAPKSSGFSSGGGFSGGGFGGGGGGSW